MDPPSILLLVVSVGLLALLLSRGRRQQRELQAVQSRLAPGTEVMTSSGLHARVVSVEDTWVVLETGPGQQSRWDRRAVARIISAPVTGTDVGESGDAERTASDVPEHDAPEHDVPEHDAPGNVAPPERE